MAYSNTAFIQDTARIRPVLVLFCDGQPSPFVWKLRRNVELVFHTKMQRQRLTGKWKTRLLKIQHASLGGLTLQEQVLLCTTNPLREYAAAELPRGLASCMYNCCQQHAGCGTHPVCAAILLHKLAGSGPTWVFSMAEASTLSGQLPKRLSRYSYSRRFTRKPGGVSAG